jgi:hypothetical protein
VLFGEAIAYGKFMSESFLPKANLSRFVGNAGVNRISQIINDEFRWIFRKVSQEEDFGIDGFADVVTEGGHVTGQSVAIQIKHGSSYLSQQTESHIVFNGDLKHLNYYHNISMPLLVIISDPNGHAYWKEFDLLDTAKTKTGWRMEIPKSNILSSASKANILELLPHFEDVSQIVEQEWELNSRIKESSIIFYHVDRNDIRARDVNNFSSFMNRLSATSGLLKHMEGKLEIFTSAYDADPRELWEIKQMIEWVSAIDKLNVPWFFFCYKDFPNFWLKLYFACLCDARREGISENGKKIRLSMNPKKVSKLLNKNFVRLNGLCERIGVSESDLRRISFAAVKVCGLPTGPEFPLG